MSGLFKTLAIILTCGIMVFTGCAGPQAPAQEGGGVIQSEKQRVAAPVVAETDQEALVSGNNEFAFDCYRLLANGGGNLFYSPFSISMALAMTYAGAEGQTEQEMKDALHYTLPQDKLHPAFNSLDSQLSSRGKDAKGKDSKGFRLNIVNALWGQQGFSFLPAFLDTLAENYGAGLRAVDFKNAAETARVTINTWVSDQTEGRIKDLIPQGAVDNMTRLVLTNAIYFNAAWQYPFEKSATAQGDFHLIDGSTVKTPLMFESEYLRYNKGNGFQAVELPYDGREISMLVLLPDAGKFSDFEESLDAEQVNGALAGLSGNQVNLTMPKFEFSSDLSLKKTLGDLGMPVAFSDVADFSGMTDKPDLYISDVIHKAFVAVDEEGTEAAAATAVIMRTTSMPAQPVEMKVDRPFIFLIRDNQTGSIIFMGRIMNPVTGDQAE